MLDFESSDPLATDAEKVFYIYQAADPREKGLIVGYMMTTADCSWGDAKKALESGPLAIIIALSRKPELSIWEMLLED